MMMFDFNEFLVNHEQRYEHSVSRLINSDYHYNDSHWNHEFLDKLKQLHLKLSPSPHTKYHIQAPPARINQTYGWKSPMYIVEDETKC